MKFLHIGLGKTSTTSLQRYVFPKIAEILEIDYNNPELIYEVGKSHTEHLEPPNDHLKNKLETESYFLSRENLVNWNPFFWEKAANINKSIFPKDTVIIITIRSTLNYFNSLYVQSLHQGLRYTPTDFFQFQKESKYLGIPNNYNLFNKVSIDDYCLESLKYYYSSHFNRVVFVNTDNLPSLDFVNTIFGLSNDVKKRLESKLINGKRLNRSYSDTAVKLTFIREKLLNKFGVKSISHLDDNKIYNKYFRSSLDVYIGEKIGKVILDNNLSLSVKIKIVLGRVFDRLAEAFCIKWRQFLQNYFDKVYPYKKYQLPSGIIPEEIILRNDKFIEKEAI